MNGPEEMLNQQQGPDAGFEQELARALQRVDAPLGFAHRLMERAAKEGAAPTASAEGVPVRSPVPSPTRARLLVMPRRQWMGWASGVIAAMLVAGVFLGQHAYTLHEKHVTAERQFDTATRITDQALAHAREQLQQQGINLDGLQ